MHSFVFPTKKKIVDNAIRKFNFYLASCKSKNTYPSITDRDGIYLQALQDKLFLESYGILPIELVKIFDELTKCHIGIGIEEIHLLSNKMSTLNIKNRKGQIINEGEELSEVERYYVTEYHKYLFANPCTKNETPFSNECNKTTK